MPQKIDISHKTVVFTVGLVLTLWLIYLIRGLILILFVAVILMSALSPLVKFFTRFKVPKAISIAITYIIIIGFVVGFFVSVVPPLAEESNKMIVSLPYLIAQFFNITNLDRSVFQSELTNISKNLFSLTLTVFDNFL